MLTRAKTINGYKLNARDGEIGKVKEFFFDDKYWTVRYLVVSTGNWFTGNQVLISPYFLGNVNHNTQLIDVDLTKDEIRNSPEWDSDKPVSRQYEEAYYGYYGAPVYWTGPYVWGISPFLMRDRDKWGNPSQVENKWDPNLRSTKEVTGYDIHATDDKIGHVEDFIIDEDVWTIRYLVIDTKNWLPGKNVLVSPEWIDSIGWADSEVYVDLSSDTIKQAPEYDKDKGISREYESKLYDYYNRKVYWTDEPVSKIYHQ